MAGGGGGGAGVGGGNLIILKPNNCCTPHIHISIVLVALVSFFKYFMLCNYISLTLTVTKLISIEFANSIDPDDADLYQLCLIHTVVPVVFEFSV